MRAKNFIVEYDRSKTFEKNKIKIGESRTAEAQSCGIGFIGAGSYAQSHLLPNSVNYQN